MLVFIASVQIPLRADDEPVRESLAGGAGCSELVLSSAVNSNGPRHDTEITAPALGTAAIDLLVLEFWSPTGPGTYDLGSGDNANYSTCQQCVLAIVDNGAGPQFFQQSGTLEVIEGQPTDSKLDVRLRDVTLIEVTIDGGNNWVSTPVPGGGCLHIASEDLVTDSTVFADGFES